MELIRPAKRSKIKERIELRSMEESAKGLPNIRIKGSVRDTIHKNKGIQKLAKRKPWMLTESIEKTSSYYTMDGLRLIEPKDLMSSNQNEFLFKE